LALARAWLREARAFHGPLCVPHDVLEACGNALELLDRADEPAPTERREALAALAWSEAVAGSFERAEELLGALGEYTQEDDLQAYDVGHARAYALMRRGRFEESWLPSVAAAEAAERAGRPDLAYGCWAAAAGAAAATGQYERGLELIDRGRERLRDNGLASIEVHMLAARAFLLVRMGCLEEARTAAELEHRLAEQLDQPSLVSMAKHDLGLVELEAGRHERAVALLSAALVEGAPISRPLTRLALAEALIGIGEPDRAEVQLRATVLEPVRPSDFPDSLVPRLTRIQGLLAHARGDGALAERRLRESVSGWARLVGPTIRADNINAVLADLGRPVVGLVEPERELARARADLELVTDARRKGSAHAVVP
jgi:ATP/maltotriose-dependent transcriptional regulator MalT